MLWIIRYDNGRATEPATAGRQPPRELPYPAPAGRRRVLLCLSRARRQRRAGGDQGIPARDAAPQDECILASTVARCGARPLQCRLEMLLRGGTLARPPRASQRGAGLELLPRQRDRVSGDALRARPHAAGAHPGAARLARGSLGALDLRAAPERPARGAFQQAAAPRHQARQRLRAQRRLAAADRFRRRPAAVLGRRPEAAAELYAGLRRARAAHRGGAARTLDRCLRGGGDALCLLRRRRAAAGVRAAKGGQAAAGAARLEWEIFHPAPRYGGLVPEAFTS